MPKTTDLQMSQNLANNILYRLEELNMTQIELARQIGVCKQSIYNCTRGDKLPVCHALYNLSKVLGISMESLLEERR